jgi:uncharacterized phage-associated protein
MYINILQSKIGNLINLLATRIQRLSMTKALKLLYMIDELSVVRYGVPITWLKYQVWKKGPVAKDIWLEIKEKPSAGFLKNYIEIKREPNTFNPAIDENTFLLPLGQYNIDEFSDNEIEIIEEIIEKYGKNTADQLVSILHKEGTLWSNLVLLHDLTVCFETRSASDIQIDFTQLNEENFLKQMAYESAKESLDFQEQILLNRAKKQSLSFENSTY